MLRTTQQRTLGCALVGLAMLAGASIANGQEGAGEAGKDAKGFYIKSGDYRLNINGHFQYRYFATFRDEASVGANNDLATGFGFKRARLGVTGNLTKELGFVVQGDFLNGDSFSLHDAYATWKFSDAAVLKVGQIFKLPVLREELNSHLTQLAVDRSTVNAVFTPAYSQGVQFDWSGSDVRGLFAFSDGFNARNSDFTSAAESDYAISARGEFRVMGEWKQQDQFTSWRGAATAGFVGAALHFQSGGETAGTLDREKLQYTIDGSLRGDGWNAFAAFVGRSDDAGASSFDDFGFVAQGGAFVSDSVELFGRYGIVLPDDSRSNGDDFAEATLGVNYYVLPQSHACKVTIDATYYFDDTVGSSAVVNQRVGDGLLTDGEEGQLALRAQLQVVF
jgi:hypothetical protein